MPLATEALVRNTGGFNHADDYHMFRFANDSELTSFITQKLSLASAWLQTRLKSGIYTSVDPLINTVVAEGEAYITLHFMMTHLKSRKVQGTHWPLESEGSERYAELIDVEFLTLAQELLGTWMIIEIGSQNFARPTFRIGTVIDPLSSGFETAEQEIEETLDRARSLAVPLPF